MTFNQAQIKAVNHKDGPMMVLAGPGSGKTTVITYRTRNLIEKYGINPSNILVVTFTKAAAVEMQERFEKLMDGRYPVTFGTFHSVFFRILKYAYNYRTENILREEKKAEYIREIIRNINLDIDDESEFVKDIISEISLVKGEMTDLNHYYSKNCPEEVFKKIYNKYNEKLISENVIDFDDMLLMCHELLSQRPDILKFWQEKYKYILIDEFQDINKVQYMVIKMLAAPCNNLFIVGDDDQSIYRFRGARPEIMLNFPEQYKNSEKIVLDTNYRCPKEVVKRSGMLIEHNKKRFKKDIKSVGKEENTVFIREFQDEREQALYVLNLIKEYKESGLKYSDIGVLFRTNTSPGILAGKLIEYNIPFRMKDVLPNIYDHWIAQNIISYIKIALGSRKRSDFLKIINRPKRYIGREAFDREEVSFYDLKQYYRDKSYVTERIDRLIYDLKNIEKMSPFAAINYIRKAMGYEDYLKEYAAFRRINIDELMDILDEITEESKDFANYGQWFKHIEEYSENLKNRQPGKIENSREEEKINLLTMHSSKGLEFKVVIIINANEGESPYKKAALEEDIEEERRMFYVAMTRAKEKLHISYVKKRYKKDVDVSRFVGEILYSKQDVK